MVAKCAHWARSVPSWREVTFGPNDQKLITKKEGNFTNTKFSSYVFVKGFHKYTYKYKVIKSVKITKNVKNKEARIYAVLNG